MEIIQAIKERRSINFFDPGREIPDDKLRELFEIANLAPSSFNLQPWKVVAVRDPERKKALRQCAFNQPKAEEASAVLIMVADPKAMEENIDRMLDNWQELGYMKPDMRDTYKGMANNLYGTDDSLKRKFFAIKNTSLFAMNLMVAAKGLGLETHPMDGFDEDCVKKEFDIPEDKVIPMLIAVGYLKPGITLLPRAWRRKIEEFVKFERY
ncbi:MAG: nitroreductase [Nitrospirae bacterium GWC2_46_6]|nr:MAG: nitroreductase [Nitrospirae bacterium GWA2_46_11]OGW21380.1 MAG: nitroreductase [Nitrospirae bacterium GWC2_46_6]OGW24635.1 MAG: nitroreductase [Nitrospirae bacterium GWB2_47_37]HAK88066.1 nitroreductase family protein [Nitrospiraceae bacterium]HCL81810.1 nitroreductase family protein [Nitrospiraceae bacterium]